VTPRLSFVFLGLSLTSSWGNGHATTYRALLRELRQRGHRVTFFERKQTWYVDNADLPEPEFCELVSYDSLAELERYRGRLAAADVVVVGSYVPEGRAVAALALEHCRGVSAFYDIDTPITLAALARGDCSYLSKELVPAFDLYLSFAGGHVLSRLRTIFGARRAEPLYCGVDPDLYYPVNAPKTWDLGYLGTYSADRQPALEQLLLEPARRLPERAFVVAGAQYPEDIVWPSQVERSTHVPPAEHRYFYSRQRWTLNLTRKDMISAGHAPSVRLFEAAACGTPIISDHSPGLSEFFEPGREIVVADGAADVVRCLQQLSESERRLLAERARSRVLAEHTSAHRARALEDYVCSLGGAQKPEHGRLAPPAVPAEHGA
jgi:spore maturation protein CgeB